MRDTGDRKIPWPGPRPYDEDEAGLFFGRKQEIHDVNRRLVAQRVALLSGVSGAGKTSLLRAGVVPLLRRRRYLGKNEGGEPREWPVLVLRDWGAAEGADVAEMLKAQMRKATRAFDSWAEVSAQATADKQIVLEALDAGGVDDDLTFVAERICKRTEGLILVFDQLEEVLRAGAQPARRMTAIIRELFDSGLPLKLLLSLRVEHITDLRGLEKEVGGLVGRTYFLETMNRQRIEEVIENATRAAGATMAAGVVPEILGWLTVEAWRDGKGGAPDEPHGEQVLDLLALQAILFELFEAALAQAPTGSIEVDAGVLAKYQEASGSEPTAIAGKALQRWITRALEPLAERAGEGMDRLAGAVPEPALTALVRRIAVRIGPHLSSGDFKVPQEQSDLFRKALGDEVWALGLTHPELRRRIRIVEGAERRLNVEELKLSSAASPETQRYLSGLALAGSWSQTKTADTLLDSFHEALRRLQRGNILKPIFSPSGEAVDQARSWELVHDRLGRAFADWAEEQRDTWEDCVPSLVASRGVSPIMIVSRGADPVQSATIRGTVEHLRWEGCLIEPLMGRAVFDEVSFRRCCLRGSIFANCVFKGGGFRNCELDGVIFRNCEFLSSADAAPFEIAESDADTLGILDSSIGNLRFASCDLTQLTIKRVALDGTMTFVRSRVFLGNFWQVWNTRAEPAIRFEDESILIYSSGDTGSWQEIAVDAEAQRHSGPLAAELESIGGQHGAELLLDVAIKSEAVAGHGSREQSIEKSRVGVDLDFDPRQERGA